MSRWYDEPESPDEYRARHDRFGNPMHGAPTPWDRVTERALGLVRTLYRRPPAGIAMPFGIPTPEDHEWRASPDIYDVLRAHIPDHSVVDPLGPMAERLFGIRLTVDYGAPEGTIELTTQTDTD